MTTFLNYAPSALDPNDRMVTDPSVPDAVREKYIALGDRYERAVNAAEGARREYDAADEDWHTKRADLGKADAHVEREGDKAGVSEGHLGVLRDRVARAAQRRAQAEAKHVAAIAAKGSAAEVLKNIKRFVDGRRTYAPLGRGADGGPLQDSGEFGGAPQGYHFAELRVAIPAGDPAKIVAAQRAEISRIKREIEDVEAAPLPLDNVLATARAEVAKEAARGKVRVELDSERRDLHLVWPTRKVNAEASRDNPYLPATAVDAAALACRFFRDEVLADVEASIRVQYEGIPLALTPSEKRKRLRELKATLLEAERIESEALWQIGNGGFRADTDPRAILGVE